MKTTKNKPVSAQQIKALQTTFHRMGFDTEARHDFIHQFTDGRVSSTKELTFDEAVLILSRLNGDQAEQVQKAQKEANDAVKAIFHLSFQISFLNKGFSSDTKEDFEMNKAKLNVFARSKSAAHKNVSEMYLSELKAFKKQLEAIAYNESNQSKNKKS